MDLQNFHLVSFRGAEFSDVLSLIHTQNNYINQIYKLVYLLNNDITVSGKAEFQEFTAHFNQFAQHQASSEGFSRAMEAVQVYHYALLEKLLDSQVLVAAEQLEKAACQLEFLSRDSKYRSNQHIVLLNQSINLLEETQLKILENLDELLTGCRQSNMEN